MNEITVREFAALFAMTVTEQTSSESWIAKNGSESLFSVFSIILPQVFAFIIFPNRMEKCPEKSLSDGPADSQGSSLQSEREDFVCRIQQSTH